MSNYSYPNIDLKRTGLLLKMKVKEAGYTVKELQEKLMLSCPQPIYRWFKGKVLPSLVHFYALSQLLQVHIEDLLVLESQTETFVDIVKNIPRMTTERLCSYMQYIRKVA